MLLPFLKETILEPLRPLDPGFPKQPQSLAVAKCLNPFPRHGCHRRELHPHLMLTLISRTTNPEGLSCVPFVSVSLEVESVCVDSVAGTCFTQGVGQTWHSLGMSAAPIVEDQAR